MGTEGFKRKITAIMSADVVGYSKLMGDDEAATVQTLAVYKNVMSSLIIQHRGRVIDSPGDNMLSEFASVVDAVQCAVAIQKELKSRNVELPENRKMNIRIGINLGDVIEEQDRIFGDGVNIAARLESLADPGGICISKTAFDHIETKLPLGYEFLGEQEVKNIAKPVGAYRVVMETRVLGLGKTTKKQTISFRHPTLLIPFTAILILAFAIGIWQLFKNPRTMEAASVQKMAFPLPDKPSFAVLPFSDLSDDTEIEFFNNGFTDTLVSALSKMPGTFVISQRSTSSYIEKSFSISQIAEELGVRYVIDGSIQKTDDRLRVTVKMIDALKGYHLWSEQYDRQFKDIFSIQDDIVLRIVKSVGGKYDKVLEAATKDVAGTNNLDAYLKNLKSYYLFNDFSRDNYNAIIQLCEEAITLDPNYINPQVGLIYTLVRGARYGFTENPQNTRERALKLAQNTVKLNESSAQAHTILARTYYELKQFSKSISAYKKAIELEPNNPRGYHVGWALCYSGRPQEAIPYFNAGIRLNPKDWIPRLGFATVNIYSGKYESAIPHLKEALEINSNYFRLHLDLAACYAALGRDNEAKAEAQYVIKAAPDFSVETYIERLPVKNPEEIKLYIDALRKIPFPDA